MSLPSLQFCHLGSKWIGSGEILRVLKILIKLFLSTTNGMQLHTMFFIVVSALHVSSGFSAHHQKLKNCTCSIGTCQNCVVLSLAVTPHKSDKCLKHNVHYTGVQQTSHNLDFSKYQLNAQLFYSSTIYMLHYAPQHVSSSTLLIIRRTNCIHTASGIVTLCKQPYSMQVESGRVRCPPAYCTAAYRG